MFSYVRIRTDIIKFKTNGRHSGYITQPSGSNHEKDCKIEIKAANLEERMFGSVQKIELASRITQGGNHSIINVERVECAALRLHVLLTPSSGCIASASNKYNIPQRLTPR